MVLGLSLTQRLELDGHGIGTGASVGNFLQLPKFLIRQADDVVLSAVREAERIGFDDSFAFPGTGLLSRARLVDSTPAVKEPILAPRAVAACRVRQTDGCATARIALTPKE